QSGDKIKRLVVTRLTAPNLSRLPGSDDPEDILKELAPLTTETVKDYNDRNKSQSELHDSFDVTGKVLLVDKQEIDEIFHDQDLGGGWEGFYKRFPDSGGFITLSRVGFNPEQSQALVLVSHYCGGLCASGTYILLQKEDGKWKILKRYTVWIS